MILGPSIFPPPLHVELRWQSLREYAPLSVDRGNRLFWRPIPPATWLHRTISVPQEVVKPVGDAEYHNPLVAPRGISCHI